jgi:hypothetical protein
MMINHATDANVDLSAKLIEQSTTLNHLSCHDLKSKYGSYYGGRPAFYTKSDALDKLNTDLEVEVRTVSII